MYKRQVEKAQQTLGILVVDGDGHVSVLHVVDPGDVLVADALNAVAAEACLLYTSNTQKKRASRTPSSLQMTDTQVRTSSGLHGKRSWR